MECTVREFDKESEKCNNCEKYNSCITTYMILMEDRHPTENELK